MAITHGEQQRDLAPGGLSPALSAWALGPGALRAAGRGCFPSKRNRRHPWLAAFQAHGGDRGRRRSCCGPGTGCRSARRPRAWPVRHRRLPGRSPGPGWGEHLVHGSSTHRAILQPFIPLSVTTEDEPGHGREKRTISCHTQPPARTGTRHSMTQNTRKRREAKASPHGGAKRSVAARVTGSRALRRGPALWDEPGPGTRTSVCSAAASPACGAAACSSLSAVRSRVQHGLPERPSGSTGWG